MTGSPKRRLSTRGFRLVVALAAAAVVSLLLTACGGSGSAGAPPGATASVASSAATQTNEGGNVTVKVTWQGTNAGPVFTVALDTHSVNLDSYDLRQLAVLRTDQGVEVSPSGWDAPNGGHHREGRLTFPTTTADGKQVLGQSTRTIELVIRNVAGVPERTFRWTT